MIKMSRKVNKSNAYNRFSSKYFVLYSRKELHQTKKNFEFFYILAIEEIDKIMEIVKKYKRKEIV